MFLGAGLCSIALGDRSRVGHWGLLSMGRCGRLGGTKRGADKNAGPSFLQTAFRVGALDPRASGGMSNETFWPSLRLRRPAASTAVAWTNTSLPPPSGEIKPKPLEVLKNFTVPMVIEFPWSSGSARATCAGGRGHNESGRFGRLRLVGAPSKRVVSTESASSDVDARTTQKEYSQLA